MKSKFGVAGFPVNFFSSKDGKKRENLFKWVRELGLDGIELQCTYGIRMKEEQALLYKKLAEENDLFLTIHAPYYISLASLNEEVQNRSREEMKKAVSLAKILGVKRIIFHPGGGYGKTLEERKIGLNRLIENLQIVGQEIEMEDIHIYPEIGGKVAQLGSLDEIITICNEISFAYPCIDLAHLHARELGSMNSKEAILSILNKIESNLGRKKLEEIHFHVYPVEYTEKGEKIHKAFGDKKSGQLSFLEDEEYYPKAEDYIEAIKEKNLFPITICEAHNSQDIGAILMKELYKLTK